MPPLTKRALVFWGGWEGHDPEAVADVFRRTLESESFDVEVSNTLSVLEDRDKVRCLHLIVSVWTMGEISKEQCESVSEAVANGTGLAGCHGGMCDAFRSNVEWQFMTGGQWVAHPGHDGVTYTINIKNSSSGLVDGLRDFEIASEQYYMHVDPAVEVLATTRFPTVSGYHVPNGVVDMPVVWTKRWGLGRVFYNSLGHNARTFDIPEALELMRRGFLWAAAGKDMAIREGLDSSLFEA